MTNKSVALDKLRQDIDIIDNQLVRLLTDRMNIALNIADMKANNVDAVVASDRVKIVTDRVADIALSIQGNEVFIRNVYGLIIEELTRMQLHKKDLLERASLPPSPL